MKKKAFLTWLIAVTLISASACGTATTEPPATTPPPTEETVTESPGTEVPTETETPPTDIPTATDTSPPEPTIESPFPEKPALPEPEKPSLGFSQLPDGIEEDDLHTIIGYSLPGNISDWTFPLKAAVLRAIEPAPDGLTLVGFVEIGGDSQLTGGYELRINLVSGEPIVEGQINLIGSAETQDVGFLRIPQIVNPDRLDSPYEEFMALGDPPDTGVAIGAQSVCFVIKTEVPQGITYTRYCSVPDSFLSVRSIFESQFAELQELMNEAADGFGLPIDVDQTISEMEDLETLKTCAAATPTSPEGTPTAEPQEGLQEACDSDITVSPVTREHFEDQLNQANIPETPTSSRFVFTSLKGAAFQPQAANPVEVAVVLIHENIQTSLGLVMPGRYTMHYWFDQNGVFYAATITGVILDEQGNEIGQVTNQQVPAVPAMFADDPDEPPPDPESEPGALISACEIFGYCSFFQWSCI